LTGNDLSSPAFFSSGSTCAVLKRAGNFSVCSDELASVGRPIFKLVCLSLRCQTALEKNRRILRGAYLSIFGCTTIIWWN